MAAAVGPAAPGARRPSGSRRSDMPPLPNIGAAQSPRRAKDGSQSARQGVVGQAPHTSGRTGSMPPSGGAESVVPAEFVRALRQLSAGQTPDGLLLEKLGAQGDVLAAGCLQIVQTYDAQLRAQRERRAALARSAGAAVAGADAIVADAAGGNENAAPAQEQQQLAAHVSFLERKIIKLREKLRKRTTEAVANVRHQDDEQGAEDGSQSPRSREQLVAEIEKMRSENARLAAEIKGPTESATEVLQAKIADAQNRIANLRAEKEAAEAAADLAKRLVTSVEAKLQTVVREREAEQSELIEEQRCLQKRLEEQALRLQELDRVRNHHRQVEALRATLAEKAREIDEEREAARLATEAAKGADGDLEHNTNLAKDANASVWDSIAMFEEVPQQEEVAVLTQKTGPTEEQRKLREDLRRVAQERDEAERALAERRHELQDSVATGEARIKELREKIHQAKMEAEQFLEDLEKKHASNLRELEVEHHEVVSQAQKKASEDESAQLESIREAREGLEQQHAEKLQALREEARVREAGLAQRAAALEIELAQARSDAELVRRVNEYRGAAWLVVRRDSFDHDALLAVITAVFNVPRGRVRIIDADAELEVGPPAGVGRLAAASGKKTALPALMDAPSRAELTALENGSVDPVPDSLEDATSDVRPAAGSSHEAVAATGSVFTPSPLQEGEAGEAAAVLSTALVPKEPVGAPLRGTRPMQRGRLLRVGGASDADGGTAAKMPSWRKSAAQAATAPVGSAVPKQEETQLALLELPGPLEATAPLAITDGATALAPAIADKLPDEQRCVFLEFLEDPREFDPSTTNLVLAEALAEAVKAGEPLVGSLATISASVARGTSTLASEWPAATASLVERRVRQVRGWQLVITVYMNLEPFMMKFVAFDGQAGYEFMLYLDKADVDALVQNPSTMRPLELVEAIVPTLRIINRDGRLLLVAVQHVDAPPSIHNGLDPALCEISAVNVDYRRQRRRLMRRAPPADPPPARPPPGPAKTTGVITMYTPAQIVPLSSGAGSWTSICEEVFMLGDRFILLVVERCKRCKSGWSSSDLRLTLQEAGHCRPFQVVLAWQGVLRQQRVLAQHCEFPGCPLLLLVEEMVTPPVLVLRLMPVGDEFGSGVVNMCFSTLDYTAVDLEVLAKTPLQRRAQLLEFLLQAPPKAKLAFEGLGAAKALANKGRECFKGSARGGRVLFEPGLICYAPDMQEVAGGASASFRCARNMGRGSAWALVSQNGRRISFREEESLFVVRVHHRLDPYSQFLVSAVQVGSCEEWELLISEEDIATRLPLLAKDYEEHRRMGTGDDVWHAAVASTLIWNCAFVDVQGQKALSVRRTGYRGNASHIDVLLFTPPKPPVAAVATAQSPSEGAAIAEYSPPSLELAAIGANGTVAVQQHEDLNQMLNEAAISGLMVGTMPTSSSGLFLVGGRCSDLRQDGTFDGRAADEATTLHSAVRHFGHADFVITLEALRGGCGHRLSAYHPDSCSCFEVSVPTRDSGCPEKLCSAQITIDGITLTVVLSETTFPHSVNVVVRESGGGEFRCTVRDEDIFEMVPRSLKQLQARCAEELLRYGAVGEHGVGTRGFFEMTMGQEPLELDDTAVPVLRLPMPLDGRAQTDASAEAIIHCSAGFVLESRRFVLSLARPRGSADLTLSISEVESGAAHLFHLCDRGLLGMYSEVRDVGGVRLLVLALTDICPRALRLAIVEPGGRRVFQMVVLDSSSSTGEVLPFPDALPARQDFLSAYLGGSASTTTSGMSLGTPAASRPGTRSGPAGRARPKDRKLLHRTTRKLPSGQPVMLTIVREMLPDSSLRFRIMMYHPVSTREISLVVLNPLLDKILGACGLGNSRTATADAVDQAKKEVAAQILPFIYVHPDGAEIELRAAPAQQPKQQ